MRTAHPLGLSPDGRNLIVVVDGGEQVAIPADERLKAALRNDRARIGQLEIDMESALRPRDIQARIRAGESLEAVAEAAGVPIARIEPFAGPVIAEREHIAGLAQTNPVRRAGEAVAHRSLRSVVTERLLSRGVDVDDAEWDAWRTEDRRWTVRLSYELDSTEHRADFNYDQTGRFCTAANDDARWLTGEQSSARGRRRGDDPDAEPSLDLNDELAIVRAIQPQFAVTPDIEDDDLDEELLDDEPAEDSDELDDGSSDSEDAFTEGDLAEVDGVYDIVPGDRSNMDVLYDMLSSFDEDSVQIYAGLVRPRPEQSAGPVLDEGPVRAEISTAEIEFDGGEPTERLTDTDRDDAAEEADDEGGEDPDLIEAEVASDDPSPAALANAAADDDLILTEPEPADQRPDATDEVAEETDGAESVGESAEDLAAAEPTVEMAPQDDRAEQPAPVADDEPAATKAEPEAETDAAAAASESTTTAEPAASEPAQTAPKARPGQVKPSPSEPEQPSLVDEAGNEPSRSIRRKRASVPSWDEIMFGAPKPKD